MRVSSYRNDPDYIGDENFGRYEIYLDGVLISGCVEADDVAGTIKTCLLNNGRYLERDGDLVLATTTGNVKIVDTKGERK